MTLIKANHIELPKEKEEEREENKEEKKYINLNNFLKYVIPIFSLLRHKKISTPHSYPQQRKFCGCRTKKRGGSSDDELLTMNAKRE